MDVAAVKATVASAGLRAQEKEVVIPITVDWARTLEIRDSAKVLAFEGSVTASARTVSR